MAGQRRPEAHRAIIYGAILGEMSLAKVNGLLEDVKGRPLPLSSYESIKKHYVPYFRHDFARLGGAIEHPPTWAKLRDAMALPTDAALDCDPADDE